MTFVGGIFRRNIHTGKPIQRLVVSSNRTFARGPQFLPHLRRRNGRFRGWPSIVAGERGWCHWMERGKYDPYAEDK